MKKIEYNKLYSIFFDCNKFWGGIVYEVYETATKLANEIKNSKEYRNFTKSINELKNDKNSENLLKEYRINQMQLQRYRIKNEKIDKKTAIKFKKNIEKKYLKIKKFVFI